MEEYFRGVRKEIQNGNKVMVAYHIEKEDIEKLNFKEFAKFIGLVTDIGPALKGSVALMVGGYDFDNRELFEIKEVRKFVGAMLKRYPYILYYTNREMETESWILASYADYSSPLMNERLNAVEAVAKYGLNPPRFQNHLIFKGGKLEKVTNAIIKHGASIGDLDGAIEICQYYLDKFSD